MKTFHTLLGAAHGARVALRDAVLARLDNRERGDVPGWVLVTLMSAGLVVAIWAIAGPALENMVRNALNSVSGP